MRENLVNDKREHFTDIIPLFSGREECESNHKFGPHIRNYYIIHFCLSGKGVLLDKFGEHHISRGQLFIIRPGEITTYIADKDTPWEYCWLAFVGDKASVFDTDKSVYTCPENLLSRFTDYVDYGESSPEIYMAIIYELMFLLFSSKDGSNDNVSKVKNYVEYNYMKALKVEEIAKDFGFERSYLFRIFKSRYGIGIKEYILNVRMSWAKRFLEEGHSVAETAYLVGYNDEFNFSRGFKKHVGESPLAYKRKLNEKQSK